MGWKSGPAEVRGSRGCFIWAAVWAEEDESVLCVQMSRRSWGNCILWWEQCVEFQERMVLEADCSEFQGRCIWRCGVVVTHWRCLIVKRGRTASQWEFFLQKENCYFEGRGKWIIERVGLNVFERKIITFCGIPENYMIIDGIFDKEMNWHKMFLHFMSKHYIKKLTWYIDL